MISYDAASLYDFVYGCMVLGLGFAVMVLPVLLALFTFVTYAILKFGVVRRKKRHDKYIVGFFHPYCNAGGGGERVLWRAVRCVQTRYPDAHIVVYTGDTDAAPDQILNKARQRFDMEISNDKLEFVYLHKRRYVEASMYPYFTMLGQSLGSIILGIEALTNCPPDVYFDTMGYAFTLPLFKYICGSAVGCYVHYPTISTDMLDAVQSRRAAYNNRKRVSRNPIATFVKLRYYRIFAWLYGKAGRRSDCVMVNSSWTEDHIGSLWEVTAHKVFPPCEVSHLNQLGSLREESKEVKIISLGQFRPEKDHSLQIKAMYELRQIITDEEWQKVKLVIIGGVRGEEDENLVKDLKNFCKYLSVEDNVEFKVNLDYGSLLTELSEGLIGIHTMWNEHFGIGIVEMMAAGLLTIAHRSGGPLRDIIIEESGARNGFLAVSAQEYAAHIAFILGMTEQGREGVRERARSSVNLFSSQKFDTSWTRATDPILKSKSS
eukprot:TRINITY_DN7649_c0_g1_i9.p1 TRINITY_DN7649_c0_g1~~TRINITY_DN7649_c0_g1_i9.p1  ORF type:complete len:489 (-),score=45.40 TRINITY_DN7649_c0_g1_i9:212-1678(-)